MPSPVRRGGAFHALKVNRLLSPEPARMRISAVPCLPDFRSGIKPPLAESGLGAPSRSGPREHDPEKSVAVPSRQTRSVCAEIMLNQRPKAR